MTTPGLAIVTGDLVATVQTLAPDAAGMVWSLLAIDRELRVLDTTPLRVETRLGEDAPATASSIERIHPFVHDERLQALLTVRDHKPGGVAHVVLAPIAAGALQNPRLLSDPSNGRQERDWAPLPTETGLHVVSWWEPTETLCIEPATGAVSRVALRPAPRIAERFQGASVGVEIPGGWLFLVNERAGASDREPLVFSRFVFMRHDFWVTAISPHFWVAARGQDVASGLTRQGDDLVAGFTSRGQEAILARIPLPAAIASLISLDAAGARVVTGGAA